MWFSDLYIIKSGILLLQNPFEFNLDDVPVELLLELIDLQINDLLKEKRKAGKLIQYCRFLHAVEFP